MTRRFEQAIENLYTSFANVKKPTSIDGCPCCIDEKGISILLSKPVRILAPNELTHYAASVFLTAGSLEDFLYFLPRILEILAKEPGWWPSPEVVGMALKEGGINSWAPRHREAVLDYFDAALDDSMTTADPCNDIDAWICALGKFLHDLSAYLERIAENPGPVSYYEANSECLAKGKLTNSFWDETMESYKQILAWFNSDKTRSLINKAYGFA